MRKIQTAVFLFFLAFSVFFPNNTHASSHLRYEIKDAGIGGIKVCAEKPGGEYATITECREALADLQHPGKYVLTAAGSLSTCKKDNSGTLTYSQCQKELTNANHPGKYKIVGNIRTDVPADSFFQAKCVRDDTNGTMTYSQCKAQIANTVAQELAIGENPCAQAQECDTALGKIPTNPQDFISKLLSIAIGVAGGFAFILMVIGSIRVLTSSGDQQKLSGGRDQIVAAIAGLLFIILSTVILRFIGIGILGL